MEVRKDWELQIEIEFSQIAKKYLSYPEKDITNLVECGTLEHYDKKYMFMRIIMRIICVLYIIDSKKFFRAS